MPMCKAPVMLLSGLDGSNPLGFLAAVGAARMLTDIHGSSIRLGWKSTKEGWRPILAGCGDDPQELCSTVLNLLKSAPTDIFDIGRTSMGGKHYNKFPFSHETFVQSLHDRQRRSSGSNRRDVDFLAGFGTDLYPDRKTNEFQDTTFRMVRSGDASRQGMLHYAKAIREQTNHRRMERTLFHNWDYQDEGYSLRWDPIEDQRYALRWKDPSKSGLVDGPGTMLAANSLAIEALRCFPTVVAFDKEPRTTGFHSKDRRTESFVWPIWGPMVSIETVSSLLALRELHGQPLRRSDLLVRGIEEVYSAQRIQPNQYYKNFLSARPLV